MTETSLWRLRTAALLAIGTMQPQAGAVEPLRQFDVVLLQPGDLIEQRVDGGADALAAYVRRLGDAATRAVESHPAQIPSAGFIVVAARPDGRVHTWLDFKPTLLPETAQDLDRSVQASAPLPVKSGEIVFALRVGLWGSREPVNHAPAPQEWRDAAAKEGRKLDVESLVDRVWPR